MNWITKNIAESITDFLDSALGFFSSWIITFFDQDIEIMTSSEIVAAIGITKTFSISLVVLMSLKQLFSVYVTETDGDPDQDPMQILVKASMALALIECNEVVFNMLQTLSKKATQDLVGNVSASSFTVSMNNLLKAMANPLGSSLIILLLLVVSLFALIGFGFQAGLRAGELALMRILFPIMACDKIGSGQEKWNSFITTYVITFLGYTLQLLCVRIGMNRLIAGMLEGSSGSFGKYFAGLTLFWLSIKTPKWMEKFVYTSGIGHSFNGMARSLGMMVPSLIRKA